MVAAIEQGLYCEKISQSAYEHSRKIANGEILLVGVNCFTGEHELEVETTRLVPHPYDAEKRAKAEEFQIANLKKVKDSRNNREVKRLLTQLGVKAMQDENLVPHLVECAKAYCSIQEVCDVLREKYGEYEPASLF